MEGRSLALVLLLTLAIGLLACDHNGQVGGAQTSAAQDAAFQWAKVMGGTDFDQGSSIAVDGSGNVYTTGRFWDTVDFDPGPGTFTLTSAGRRDVFISKLDATGAFVWAKALGGTGDDLGMAIAVDDSGNVYTTGHFWDTVDFDPGPGTFTLTSSAGRTDIFISKLDATGAFVWAKAHQGGAGPSIAVDGSGNVYTTGHFWDTVDFDPGPGTFTISSAGSGDVVISKLDATGAFVWAKALGGPDFEASTAIAVDDSGNVYTTGRFQGTGDFDPGPGTFTITSAGFGNIFISKLDASGAFVWAKAMGGTSNDFGYGIAVDSSGNVYTTGVFHDTVDFDPGVDTFNLTSAGRSDIFNSKLDATGAFVWAKALGGSYGSAIAVDSSGNVYTTGGFQGTVDFDPGSGTFNLTSAGGRDIFISKLDATGAFVWAKALGGTGDDLHPAIAVDGSGNVYTTGAFGNTVDFDPGPGTFTLTSAGGTDIFILKLGTPPTAVPLSP